MMSNQLRKIAVFVDAGNLWSSYKILGKVLDFNKLESFFAEKFKGDVFGIFYYVAYPREGTRAKKEIDNVHKFLTWLKKGLRYHVIKKPLKIIFIRNKEGKLIYDQNSGKPESIEKGNFDVEIAIDALNYLNTYDIGVFLTGDSDFLPLISYLRNGMNKKKVYVFSTEGCVSHELRTGSDGYFDLQDFPEIHGNELANKKDIQK